MADNIVEYTAIEQAKTIIIRSTTEIENLFKTMSSNISENYSSQGGAALSGAAGSAIANAWTNFSNSALPPLRSKLTELTDTKLTEWGRQFDLTEEQITQALAGFEKGV